MLMQWLINLFSWAQLLLLQQVWQIRRNLITYLEDMTRLALFLQSCPWLPGSRSSLSIPLFSTHVVTLSSMLFRAFCISFCVSVCRSFVHSFPVWPWEKEQAVFCSACAQLSVEISINAILHPRTREGKSSRFILEQCYFLGRPSCPYSEPLLH